MNLARLAKPEITEEKLLYQNLLQLSRALKASDLTLDQVII